MMKNTHIRDQILNNSTIDHAARPVGFIGDDKALAAAFKSGNPGAREAVFERYADHVRRVLYRILGTHAEVREQVQEVFIQAFASAHSLRDETKLKSWLTRLTVYSAISFIREKKKNRWLEYSDPTDIENNPAIGNETDAEDRRALMQVYDTLDKMPVKERVPFVLRFVEGLQLSEVAEACGVSLATAKRRLGMAETRFIALAEKSALLREWKQGGTRWRGK